MVKLLNNLHRKKEEPAPAEPEAPPAPPAPTTEELLAEIRDLLKAQEK
jgi:large conductance mechanosensitive channel